MAGTISERPSIVNGLLLALRYPGFVGTFPHIVPRSHSVYAVLCPHSPSEVLVCQLP